MGLHGEFLSMTIKGIIRSCFGSVFDDDEEVHKMTHFHRQVLINLYSAQYSETSK